MSVTTPSLGAFVSPFTETEDTIRARLLSAVPTGLSQEPGTWVRDFVEINVAEFNLQYTALGWLVAQMFPAWASGQQLDAWGEAYGLTRGAGTFATGVVRFFAVVGTAIPPTTIVEVPLSDPASQRLQYQTTNPATVIVGQNGYADLPVAALQVGVAFNQPVGAVALLDSPINNVSQITNVVPMVGGADPQTDSDFRPDVLAQAALPSGAGTQLDYVVWGNSVPGVGSTSVYTQWDTSGLNPGIYDGRQNGSVLLSLRDTSNAPVDWSVAYAAQITIDPARELVSMFEQQEGWAPTPDLNPPAAPTITVSDAGGTLPASTTLNYVIVAMNSMGQSLPSPEASSNATSTGASSSALVEWGAVPGATQYGVFGRTQGGELLIATTTQTSYLDTGSVTPNGALPIIDSSAPVPVIWDGDNVQIGQASLQVQYPISEYVNYPIATAVALTRIIDLSRFASAGEIAVWIRASDWSQMDLAAPWLIFAVDGQDYFSASPSEISLNAAQAPTGGSEWWQWCVPLAQFTPTGTPDWAGIGQILLQPWVNEGGVEVNFDYMIARYPAGAIGVGGLAPVGADVTCMSPVTLPVDVTISNTLLNAGYTLIDTPGTTNATTLLTASLNAYFQALAPGADVRFIDIADAIHNTVGIVDFELTLPDATGAPPSVPVAITQDAALGTLLVS